MLDILCKLVKIWYLVNVSANTSHNINFEVCHRVLSQSVYALLSLIRAMLNMSTLSTNDQSKSFENWSMAVSTKSWLIIADEVNYDVVHLRLFCKEYLTLI